LPSIHYTCRCEEQKKSKPTNKTPSGVDLGSLYPAHLKPTFITSIREFYITTYADRFFSHPPAWFNMYVWVELIYHLPLSFWAIGALIRGEIWAHHSIEKETLADPEIQYQMTPASQSTSLCMPFR